MAITGIVLSESLKVEEEVNEITFRSLICASECKMLSETPSQNQWLSSGLKSLKGSTAIKLDNDVFFEVKLLTSKKPITKTNTMENK